MQKNLVVFHLESLSNEILYHERDNLQFIINLMEKSMVFERFYSSATSSILAFTDFCYGNDFELDNSYDVDNDLRIEYREKNLFNILEDNGYNIKGLAYPVTWRDDLNNKKIWDLKSGKYNYFDNESEFINEINETLDKSIKEQRPFALHIWDIRSHIFYTDDKKNVGQNFFERRSIGYRCIDETYEKVFSMLVDKDVLDNTLIVAYGDHGDELWSHSLNGGFCHAFEPYTTLIHTPCFFYAKDFKPNKVYDLVSLIDLKWSILHLLNIDETKEFILSGKNIFTEKNDFVFSRNLLANQKRNNALRKGYSVTNKDYHLIVSELGLELYAPYIDPTNSFNLLQFFRLKENKLIDFNNRGAWHTHFRMIMKQDQIEHIQTNFTMLFDALYDYVTNKNKFIEREELHYFDMEKFKIIKSNEYQWN